MEEVWKDIKGYEGDYQVSNLSNVRSLRYGNNGPNQKGSGVKNLKQIVNSAGYYIVNLYKNGKIKQHFVHRLVAEAFIPNPNMLNEIDHINTNKLDNKVFNLRWVTHKENINNPISSKKRISIVRALLKGKTGKGALTHKSVIQYTLDGDFVKKWDCMMDACRFYKMDSGSLTRACQGEYHKVKGFAWRYVGDNPPAKRPKIIHQYSLDGKFINSFVSISEAAKITGIKLHYICGCINGRHKTTGGYIWKRVLK